MSHGRTDRREGAGATPYDPTSYDPTSYDATAVWVAGAGSAGG